MEKFLAFVSSIRWQDAVDIVLNSYILFRLYVLFRGTNAIRVLIGIAFLWFFQRVSVSLGLIVTSWAIQGIIAFAAVIIIVVFRNEIRSILQARNLKTILWGIPRRALDTPVEIIAESAFELARRRVGALLVLPGEEDLSEVIHGGVPWQGKISKEMIISIFWPDNPVHDGAVIIQGDQVSEVGAVIPLSHREDLPYYYGTRHRAAVGLAEQTDALVIAVSEERGQVSVAKGQDFRVVHDREDLERNLDAHAGGPSRQEGHSRKRLLELGAAAALSFLFMGGVWFSFTRGQDTLITVEVPIEYVNRDTAMEILETSRNTVDLELSGSGALIRSIRPDQVKVRLDLSGAVPGTNAFAVTSENVSLPPGILLKNIRPATVEVSLDVLIRKELPVQVDWAGRLPEGRIITEAKLDPQRVQVSGVKQALERITTLYTEKVPVDHIEKSGSISVRLALNSPSLKMAGGSREKIAVDFIVKERVLEP
ncbi:MAG: diadenylate cyclase [Deltaproteobacteria bacterium]|nr:diadenylate cyclase [Deltaproteobacteria bacterium]